MNVPRYDTSGAEAGSVELSDVLFGVEPNETVIHQAVVAHLANRRQGTASTKGRSEVSGTNRKPFRQKKTGQARRGDLKTNLLRGGGIWGGPNPRSYRQKLSKKQRRLALRSALSIRARESAVVAIADIPLESGKTREVAELIRKVGLEGKRVLIVTSNPTETLLRASRNLPNVSLVPANSLHPYEVMCAEHLLFTDSAVAQLNAGGAE